MSWRIRLAVLTTAASVACGDLSNEDLVFESALPDKSLELNPPQSTASDGGTGTTSQALGGDDGWVIQTNIAQKAARETNVFVDQVLNHLEAIGARSPAVRSEGYRQWNAVRIESTGLWARLTMNEVTDVACDVPFAPLPADALQFRWTIEVSKHPDTGFVGMITGQSEGIPFSHSCGTVSVNAQAAEGLGISYNDNDPLLTSVQQVTESWERNDGEATLTVDVQTNEAADAYFDGKFHYFFQREADDSGLFHFAVTDQVRDQGEGTEHLNAVLQWQPLADPWRTDFCLTPKSGNLICGTGCGPDVGDRTYLTYGAGTFTEGSPNACVPLQEVNPLTPSD